MRGLFQTYKCARCAHVFESVLDVCGKCGGLAHKVSGIEACLSAGRPPGYAGGKSTPHSARSYDARMAENFKVLKITDCVHKEGPNGEKIPVCSFANRPTMTYNSAPNTNNGQPSFPIKAYHSPSEMSRDLAAFAGRPVDIPMKMDGNAWAPPNVHPQFEVGSQMTARRPQTTLKDRTMIVARHKG